MKRVMIGLVVLVLLVSVVGCAAASRSLKDFGSSVTGLNRVMTVYDANGDVLRTYTGTFDIQSTQYGNEVKFDINGKRHIIYNAIVVVDEQ